MPIKFSDMPAPLECTDDFLVGLQLVTVTKDGYEYTESP